MQDGKEFRFLTEHNVVTIFRDIQCAWLYLPGGMDSVADGDNVSRSSYIQVRPREGDKSRVSHSMLVPVQHITQTHSGPL